MKTILIIWGVVLIACILEGYFCSQFIDDEYGGENNNFNNG